jgi:hypothetical protein
MGEGRFLIAKNNLPHTWPRLCAAPSSPLVVRGALIAAAELALKSLLAHADLDTYSPGIVASLELYREPEICETCSASLEALVVFWASAEKQPLTGSLHVSHQSRHLWIFLGEHLGEFRSRCA